MNLSLNDHESLGDSETDYFKDVLLDFVRWDMTVSLQKLTACEAEIFYFLWSTRRRL